MTIQKSVRLGIFVFTVSALVWGSTVHAQNSSGYTIEIENGAELFEQANAPLREAEDEKRRSQNEGQQTQSHTSTAPSSSFNGSGGGGGSSSGDAIIVGSVVAIVVAVAYFGYRYFKKNSDERTKLTTVPVPILDRSEFFVMHPCLHDDPLESSMDGIHSWEQLAAGSVGVKVAF